MTFDEYQRGVLRTFGQKDEPLKDKLFVSAIGLGGEVGEYLDKVKKLVFHGHQLSGEEIVLELGDALYYLTVAASIFGATLEDVAKLNNEKLKKRYPNGFSPERSKNRDD